MNRILMLILLWPSLTLGCGRKDKAPQEPPRAANAGHESEETRRHGKGDHAEHGKEKDDHSEIVRLSPNAVATNQIQLVEARKKPLAQGLAVPARIVFPQTGTATVAARVPGRLGGIAVELGRSVKKGAILGYLESPELGQARADYLSRVTKARVAENNYRREQELLKKGITSEREAREAESVFVTAEADRNAADARLHALGLSDPEIQALRRDEHYSSRFPLRSPIDGTVVEIHGTIGQSVESTTPLFTVGQLDHLWAMLDVFEAQLPSLRIGQSVSLTVPAAPGRPFTGRVQYIGDVVEEKTRAIHVRVLVPNPDRALKPGMFATAEVATGQPAGDGGAESARLIIPREAVQQIGSRQVVFTPAGENQFRAVEVRTGVSSASEIEILSGIEPGVRVVTRGAFVLKSELSKESLGEGHGH